MMMTAEKTIYEIHQDNITAAVMKAATKLKISTVAELMGLDVTRADFQTQAKMARVKVIAELKGLQDDVTETVVAPNESIIDATGDGGDFKSIIGDTKVTMLAGNTPCLWADGLMDKNSLLDSRMSLFLGAIDELQNEDKLPVAGLRVSIYGTKTVFSGPHPSYIKDLRSGKIGFSSDRIPKGTKLPVYAFNVDEMDERKNRMVEMTLILSCLEMIVLKEARMR